ncbi:hypothetical protein CC78DRAFT_556282 [Lojkania enalia]|uniref:Uncharacterized protein n=1 Tax=Lojkania enalia TaxID=147567 RepID=A0A9P4JYS5_9PLEO|nr:hypothetical protein CC78DRAFT_556282 [Didymosphaeria enalia]
MPEGGETRCPNCDHESRRSNANRKWFWAISAALHLSFFVLTAIILGHFKLGPHSHRVPIQIPVDHESRLVGSVEGMDSITLHFCHFLNIKVAPLSHYETFMTESASADAWGNPLFFGEPNYEYDWAWINNTSPRSFRLSHGEAARLNFTDRILIQPGDNFGSMLGFIHNLHCLVCPPNIGHVLPDLNPHPFCWYRMKYHDITVSAKVTRRLVNWEAFQERLTPRDFISNKLMWGTGPSN